MNVSRRIAEPLIALDAPIKCHIVGIGGPGMSAIGRLLVEMGHTVTGSDLHESEVIEDLRQRGAEISIGHQEATVHGADVVTYSTAIPSSNVELVEARRIGLETRHRSGMLASLCAATRAVGIAGTHGKTTTTALITAMTTAGGLRPSSIIGADVLGGNGNVHGDGSLLIIEADESDGTLDVLPLSCLLVTNIDIDHLDYFGSFEAITACFADAIERTQGFVVLNADDTGSADIVRTLGSDGRVSTFGWSASSTVRITSSTPHSNGTVVEVCIADKTYRCELSLRGEHNVMNFAAALAMSVQLGVDPDVACAAAVSFRGVARRFTERGDFRGSLLIDDYAHLPAEISATIGAVRSHPALNGRVIAVFQPNRYHRIATMADSYADCFVQADRIVITDVYASGTQKIEGVTGELVVKAIRSVHRDADVVWAPSRSDIVAAVDSWIAPGDICISMGCGDIETFPEDLRGVLK
ncbi:MAG: UDP-N-acetylmuramate--L-alanine ligase [Acidimicrobium sp.]|nr:MAG: UDP-N-acetylmuramate--L-alanine ligase [Acidimicrobium sp.]